MAPKKSGATNGELFISQTGQLRLVDKSAEQQALENRKVECLGMTFANDEERRTYFLGKLKEKLADPEFRKTPGFPKGTDEDILRLSDPPWYTACPNPFLASVVANLESRDNGDAYDVAPFAADLSESRDDGIYTAHTYHTKVPPRAIARLIFHYTKPGDVVLDAFCGSGMTGVAAMMCADPKLALELGGTSGARFPVLCDLAPAATFIAANYLRPPSAESFLACAEAVLDKASRAVDSEWTIDLPEGASVDYVVWLEVFECPHCQCEVVTQDILEATEDIGSAKTFSCSRCAGSISKAPAKGSGATRLIRHRQSYFDNALNAVAERINRVPAAVEVRIGRQKHRIVLSPEAQRTMQNDETAPRNWFPTTPLIKGERYLLKDCLAAYGISHVHHFYLPRQLRRMAALWACAQETTAVALRNSMLFLVTSNGMGLTVLNRFAPKHNSQVNRQFSGTLYVPSTVAETSVRYGYGNKAKRLAKAFAALRRLSGSASVVTTQSCCAIDLPDESVDYVFVDPPFGRNLQYSELNQIWEAWLRVATNRDLEAVLDSTRGADMPVYTGLMREAFSEMARVLKPGRWITVEFHNSSNAVWMAIQEALLSAGFVVADVRVLNKERDTYKQNRQGVVKRDLMISAYKVPTELAGRVSLASGALELVWDFVRTHLRHLPTVPAHGEDGGISPEREDFMLYDRMIAFHVLRAASVPCTFAEFSEGLKQRFVERDGRYFLNEQAVEYDRYCAKHGGTRQESLFVHDEASALRWLRRELTRKPQSIQELHPTFTKELQAWSKHECPVELVQLLEESFLFYDDGPVPSQIHSYLSSNFRELRNLDKGDALLRAKAKGRWYVADPSRDADLERLRMRTLIKEFGEYRLLEGRKLRQFRTEAIRAGFRYCYEASDYESIVSVAAKLPDSVLQEDEKLLMYYDVACMRRGET